MARILILISGHLCNAPRPQKEAEALSSAGYDVTIAGLWFEPEFIERDRLLILNKKWKFVPIINFQPSHRLTNLQVRLRSRLAKEIFIYFGFLLPDLLGYGAKAMLKYAQTFKADLTIVHSEGGLWAGSHLLKCGYKVGVDFEDWFSEDLLPEARVTRPIKELKELEKKLINECQYCITTSQALAEAMAKEYNAPKPIAIYNAFPWTARSQIDFKDNKKRDRRNLNLPSLHWFSQTIGAGRGLETLFQALNHLSISVEVHLRGNCSESTNQWLKSQIPSNWRDRIFIHSTVPNQELLLKIAEHDIGLAIECGDIISRNLTVTNKFFQYIQAGLAVIATNTVGQKEVMFENPEIGRLIPHDSPILIAQAIESLLHTTNTLNIAKLASLQLAKEKFSWEFEAKKVTQLADKVLQVIRTQ